MASRWRAAGRRRATLSAVVCACLCAASFALVAPQASAAGKSADKPRPMVAAKSLRTSVGKSVSVDLNGRGASGHPERLRWYAVRHLPPGLRIGALGKVRGKPSNAGTWVTTYRVGILRHGRLVPGAQGTIRWTVAAPHVVPPEPVSDPTLSRVSVSSAGAQAEAGGSWQPSVSADGRYIAFGSEASNLVAGDTNGFEDIFVRDLTTGVTERVSVSSDGTEGDQASTWASISADGRFVAFSSLADNLVAGEDNSAGVYVRDRQTGTTTHLTPPEDIALDGIAERPSISADGQLVAFVAYTSGGPSVSGWPQATPNVFLADIQTGDTVLVSHDEDGNPGRHQSFDVMLSGNGRFVAYTSQDTAVVPDDANGALEDVLVYDRVTGVNTRVAVSTAGVQGNSFSGSADISADGQTIVFTSSSDNLDPGSTAGCHVYVRDLVAGTTKVIGPPAKAYCGTPAISDDGQFVAFEGASNRPADGARSEQDVFLLDRSTGDVQRVSAAPGAEPDSSSWSPALGASGGFVAFDSYASNLVPGDTNGLGDVFVWHRGA